MTGSPLLLGIAAALPWLAGSLLAHALLGGPRAGRHLLALGLGYPLGMLLVMLLVLGWNALGLRLAPVPLLAALGLMAAVLGYLTRRGSRAVASAAGGPGNGRLGLLLAGLLSLLLLYRLGTLGAELLARPLFAWDAWMNWAPKAIVWFHEQRLVPFVDPRSWLAAAPDSGVFTLGNRQASEYPPGVPIIMLWHMLALGSTASSWVYLPWVLLPLALACACAGALRSLGASAAVAALGAYLLVSIPFLGMHSALAGYADLWLAAYFGLAVLALVRWQTTRQRSTLVLLCLLAAGAALVKVPGLAFAGIVIGLCLARLPGWSARMWYLLGAAAAVAGVLAFGLGLELTLPGGAALEISRERLTLPYLGTLELGAHPLAPILARTFFVSANWHLFWPLLTLAVVARGRRLGLAALADPLLQALVLAGALLYFVFGFTDYFAQAANLVTLNRTLLYLLVPGILLIAGELAAWLRRGAPTHGYTRAAHRLHRASGALQPRG